MKAALALLLTSAASILGGASAQNCTICGGNATDDFERPDASYEGISCAELQESIMNITNSTECDDVFASSLWSWIDVPSWCGCPNVDAPDTCQICGDDEVLGFPNEIVPWDDEDLEYSCSDAVDMARHVPDSTMCTDSVATTDVKETCCRPKGFLCPICPLSDTPFDTTAQYEGFTCGQLQAETEFLNTDECTDYFNAGDKSWLEWGSLCKCEGYNPAPKCTLCGEGMMVVNPEATAWENDVYTCAEADKLARHVSSLVVCADEFQTDDALAACCGPDPNSAAAVHGKESAMMVVVFIYNEI
eukprot:scaffold22578_cov164-Cylindrotheca_fusiformis.AAC.15